MTHIWPAVRNVIPVLAAGLVTTSRHVGSDPRGWSHTVGIFKHAEWDVLCDVRGDSQFPRSSAAYSKNVNMFLGTGSGRQSRPQETLAVR